MQPWKTDRVRRRDLVVAALALSLGAVAPTGRGTASAESPASAARSFSPEGFSRAGDYIEEKAGVVGEKIKNLQGKNFSEIADEAKDYARRKPGHAILISAAAGLFLGFLLRNGRRVF